MPIAFYRGFEDRTLLTGVRGKPAADVDALCDAIVSVSNLAVSLGEQLLALDINPLVVHTTNHGVVAVDALSSDRMRFLGLKHQTQIDRRGKND